MACFRQTTKRRFQSKAWKFYDNQSSKDEEKAHMKIAQRFAKRKQFCVMRRGGEFYYH